MTGRPRILRARLPAARAAVAVGFMLSGAGFASWVVRIPDVQQRLGLSEGVLGLALFGVSAGGLLAMPLSALLIARYGSRPVALGATLGLAGSIALPPHAPGPLALALILVVVGASTSVMAVALNTQAAAVERRVRRPIMAGLHALYSLGGLLGAGLGGAVAGAGYGPAWHLGAAGGGIAALALASTPFLLGQRLDGASRGRGTFARPGRPLLILGLIAFCVLFGEGAVADWSAVYLRDATGAGPALAATGYAAFSLMMAAGRFVGDALTVRLGPVRVVRAGGGAAALGIALAVAQSHPWASVAGFALIGAGLSTVFPTVVAAAGRIPGTAPSGAIAVVSSIGYLGLLAGPPLIGLVAEAASLRSGLAAVGVAALLIAALAGALPGAQGFRPRESRSPRRKLPRPRSVGV